MGSAVLSALVPLQLGNGSRRVCASLKVAPNLLQQRSALLYELLHHFLARFIKLTRQKLSIIQRKARDFTELAVVNMDVRATMVRLLKHMHLDPLELHYLKSKLPVAASARCAKKLITGQRALKGAGNLLDVFHVSPLEMRAIFDGLGRGFNQGAPAVKCRHHYNEVDPSAASSNLARQADSACGPSVRGMSGKAPTPLHAIRNSSLIAKRHAWRGQVGAQYPARGLSLENAREAA